MFSRLSKVVEGLRRGLDKWAAESGRLDRFYFKPIPESRIDRYEPRQISQGQARREILSYLKENRGKDSFDVAVVLHLDPTFAADVCDDLLKKGRIELDG